MLIIGARLLECPLIVGRTVCSIKRKQQVSNGIWVLSFLKSSGNSKKNVNGELLSCINWHEFVHANLHNLTLHHWHFLWIQWWRFSVNLLIFRKLLLKASARVQEFQNSKMKKKKRKKVAAKSFHDLYFPKISSVAYCL